MFSTAEKTNNHAPAIQRKAGEATFFRKAGEESFFGAKEPASFFAPKSVQAKLSVSSPDDPQEKEADAMADQVMRMSESTAAPAQKEEEKPQRKEEESDNVQAKPDTGLANRIQCKEKEEEPVQAKLFRKIQRSEETAGEASCCEADAASGSDTHVNRKNISIHRSDIIQRSGRGPPTSSIPFEQSLSSSKGSGSVLPGDTRQFMESRFNADFSGVRIHTGNHAESMSSQINAQAFTHGNDIYFNAGKYSPTSASGSTLLAHELTHTIQQGASKPVSASSAQTTTSVSAKRVSVSRKEMIHRSADGVPVQLTNAVAKAKSMEGKINAKLPGPDGYRTGWQHLVEIFKSTFGEDKIISGSGGTSVPGTVAEQDIKKYREAKGAVLAPGGDPASVNPEGMRDAMPSWCGIFVFWALNKSGVPMPKWELGRNVIKPEAVNPPGYIPKPGDIAWRKAYSHFAIVESVNGDTIKTVNGNTAGADNLGGQVQTVDHKLDSWTAFFSPLMTATGPLTSGEAPINQKPKSFKDLRKELKVNRKEGDDHEEESHGKDENAVQAKPELSNWSVDSGGSLSKGSGGQTGSQSSANINDKKIQPKEEEKKEEEDKQALTSQPVVQKKQAYDIHAKCSECSKEENKVQAKYAVQLKTDTADSSLNTYTNAETSEQTSEMDRGPPVQAKLISGNRNIIQRSVIDDALEFAGSVTDCITTDLDKAKKCGLQKAQQVAMHIPGYKALRVVLNEDPITGDYVERNGRNFIEAAFDIMPGGSLLHKKLDEQHQLDAAAAWIDEKMSEVQTLVNGLFSAITKFWDGLGKTDFLSPMDVLRNGANIVLGFIDSVIDFAVKAAEELLEMIKKFLLDKIVDFIKTKTTAYPLLCVILEQDPITKQKVGRNGTNILNALLELGGEEGKMQRDQMKETGTFQKVAAYIDEGIKVFGNLYQTIIDNFGKIWDMVKIESLMEPAATFEKIYNIFADPVKKVFDFVERVVKEILKLIKDVLFKRISAEAKKVRGYFLMTVIINKDPFTGEVVPRSVENVIHGFMSLMDGGEEQFQQMKESGAIDKAVGKINAAVKKLNMTLEAIIQLFIDLWESFTFKDFLNPIATFKRIIDKFGEPIGRLIAFVVEIVKIVVEVILIIMNFPFDLINKIIANAMKSFHLIKADPIGFLKNLLRAIKEGFIQFFDNILQHLIQGLVAWLTMELKDAGVPELKDLSLKGIISWVLEVLGISMEKIWEKLAKHPKIGPAKVAKIRSMINTLEGIWTFIKDVQERGMAAIWDKIQEQLSNLWNTVLDAIKNWIMDKIITAVVTKLLSMLDPTGIMAVVNSCIAIYKAIQSFIKYLRQMLEILNSFVEGVAEIASGNTKKAADFLEKMLAKGIPIVIGFLANQVGLGGIGKKIGEMIEKAREMVDKALDWLVNKAVDVGGKLLEMGKAAVGKVLGWFGIKKEFTLANGEVHEIYFEGSESAPMVMVASKNPRSVEALVAARKSSTTAPALTPVQNNSLTQALTKKTEMDNYIKTNKTTTSTGGTSTEALSTGIGTRLDAIKLDLVNGDAIAASPALPLSNITYSTDGAKAKTVIGKPLTKLPGNTAGSAPVQVDTTPPGWQHIRAIEGAKITMWVKAHMVNENLHGPGQGWNLVPATQQFNSQMRVGAEKWAKDEVAKDEIIHYKAEVTGWHSNATNPLISNYFPSTVTVTYGYMVNAAKNRTQETSQVATYSQDAPPETAGATGPPNINTMTRDNMRSMFAGVTNVDTIYSTRNSLPNSSFRDLSHMYLRLRDAYNKSPQFESKDWPIISQKYNFGNAFKF